MTQLGIYTLLAGRNTDRGNKAAEEIRGAGAKADFISSDGRDAASGREVAKSAIALGNGQLDILIDQGGIFPFVPAHETTEVQFDGVYSTNVNPRASSFSLVLRPKRRGAKS